MFTTTGLMESNDHCCSSSFVLPKIKELVNQTDLNFWFNTDDPRRAATKLTIKVCRFRA